MNKYKVITTRTYYKTFEYDIEAENHDKALEKYYENIDKTGSIDSEPDYESSLQLTDEDEIEGVYDITNNNEE